MQNRVRRLPIQIIMAVLILLIMATVPLHQAVTAKSSGSNNNDNGMNVIFGTRSYTKGTSHDDTIIACPIRDTVNGPCNLADTLRGLEGNDILQGSGGPDTLYGDDGADTATGGAGDDKIYGGPGDDVHPRRS